MSARSIVPRGPSKSRNNSGTCSDIGSGAVEGNVNRIKMIKRQMYGRARFALLRKRVLLAS